MNRRDAQRLLQKFSILLRKGDGRISFSGHFKRRMRERNLFWSPDALNVIHGGKIVSDGQFESNTELYRYRVETRQMVLVVEFLADDWIRCVSGWRKRQ